MNNSIKLTNSLLLIVALLSFTALGDVDYVTTKFQNEESIENYTPPKTYTYNFNELNNVQTNIASLTTSLMGDRIDPATGTVSWMHTDISLPGNFGLEVAVKRELSDTGNWTGATRELGNWSLAIPHVRSSYVTNVNGNFDGLLTGGVIPAWAENRACSSGLNSNPDLQKEIKLSVFGLKKENYWQGDTISIPGVGSEKILIKDLVKKTTSNWKVECIDTAESEGEVDAFKVTLPNGVTYLFSKLKVVESYKDVFLTSVGEPCLGPCDLPPLQGGESTPDEKLRLKQIIAFMQVSQVTDRFGNWVKYEYDTSANLVKIHSSDNRQLDILYNDDKTRITEVSANTRIWKYDYQTPSSIVGEPDIYLLETVTLPDTRMWEFEYPVNDNEVSFWDKDNIADLTQLDPGSSNVCSAGVRGDLITIKHPSGAKGKFAIKERCVGQAAVPKLEEFNHLGQGAPYQAYALQVVHSQYALSEKKIDLGDGTVYHWDYNYSNMLGYFYGDAVPPVDSFSITGLPDNTDLSFIEEHLADVSATLISNPDGSYNLSVSDRRYGYQNGKQKYYATYDSAFKLMSYEISEYQESPIDYGETKQIAQGIEEYMDNPMPPPFQDKTVFDTSISSSKHIRLTSKRMVVKHDIGESAYIETFSNFNGYEQALEISQTGPNDTRNINLGFAHDVTTWVFNQTTTVDVNVNAEGYTRLSENVYHSKTHSHPAYRFQLSEEKHFGATRKSYPTYQTVIGAKGQIKDVDLHLNTTGTKRRISFNNYHRGQAQSISVPKRLEVGTMTMSKVIDDNGWVTSTADFNGVTTHYDYTPMGLIKAVDLADDWLDSFFSYQYPEAGGLVRTIQRCLLNTNKTGCASTASLTTTETYDAFYRLKANKTFDDTNAFRFQNFEYNPNNQQTFVSFVSDINLELKGVENKFDVLGRKQSISQTGAGTQTFEYLSGNRIKLTNARDFETITSYRAFSHPAYEVAKFIDSPEGVNTEFSYDPFGHIKSIRQFDLTGEYPVDQTEYHAYDSFKRLCQVKRNDIGTTVFSYNLLGELQWQASGQIGGDNTDCTLTPAPNDKINYSYDNLGSQRTISYGNGTPTLTYTLDNNGNVKTITGGGFSQSYNYNSLNLLEDETLTVDGKNLKLDYGYTGLGYLDSLQYPDVAIPKVDFATNPFGQATQAIRDYADNKPDDVFVKGGATYYPSGSINTFIYGNDVVHKTTLNSRLMPTSITDKFGTTSHVNLSYNYDKNSNITSITNTRDNNAYSLSLLTYDGLDRLISTTGGDFIGSSTLAYDGLGNIRSYTNTSLAKPSDLAYSYTNNRLSNVTGVGSTGYNFSRIDSYDNRGNVTHNGKREFDYNLANQMTKSGKSSFVYDGYNRRVISVKDNDKTEYSMYSQSGKLLYRETDQGGINYIFLGSKLVAKEGAGVFSQDDSIMNYKPFGDSIEEPKDDVGYTGHKFDTDLGLSYMQARYYDPVIGRFYSNDPVGYTASNPVMSFNRYMYVNNNPYKYTDPNGEYLWGINIGVSGTLFGTNFSISLSAAADHNGTAQLTLTPEVGASSKKFAAGGFVRLMGGGEKTTVASLEGAGTSVSHTEGRLSTSVTTPAVFTDGSGPAPEGLFNGTDIEQAVVEIGIGTPTKGRETTATVGTGIAVKTEILGDIGRAIGSAAHDAKEWIDK
jgi:RHS repeat-associated protein